MSDHSSLVYWLCLQWSIVDGLLCVPKLVIWLCLWWGIGWKARNWTWQMVLHCMGLFLWYSTRWAVNNSVWVIRALFYHVVPYAVFYKTGKISAVFQWKKEIWIWGKSRSPIFPTGASLTSKPFSALNCDVSVCLISHVLRHMNLCLTTMKPLLNQDLHLCFLTRLLQF